MVSSLKANVDLRDIREPDIRRYRKAFAQTGDGGYVFGSWVVHGAWLTPVTRLVTCALLG